MEHKTGGLGLNSLQPPRSPFDFACLGSFAFQGDDAAASLDGDAVLALAVPPLSPRAHDARRCAALNLRGDYIRQQGAEQLLGQLRDLSEPSVFLCSPLASCLFCPQTETTARQRFLVSEA